MHATFPGDVLVIFDSWIKRPKLKWHVCICGEDGLFFRINSNPLFRPNHFLSKIECPFLKHDSYVELSRLLQYSPQEIHHAMSIIGNYKGRLSTLVRRDLAHAAEKAPTLTPEQKDLVRTRLLREHDVSDEDIWDFPGDE